MDDVIGLLVDLVGSRSLRDRSRAQQDVQQSFQRAHTRVEPLESLWATAGDEFQAVYSRVEDAIVVSALVRLDLPSGVECRFGMGRGSIRRIEPLPDGRAIQDGSAWWNARAAIEVAHRHALHGDPYLRSWYVEDGSDRSNLINAYLTSRDHVISRMKGRERRIVADYLQGTPQKEIAEREHLSQSAVSQNILRSGGRALAAEVELLLGSLQEAARPTS